MSVYASTLGGRQEPVQTQLITLTPMEAEVCPPRPSCRAISVPLTPCLTGLYSLHFHAKNTPLIGLAFDHMHSDPTPPLILVSVSATREPGQGMPIHAPKSSSLYCSDTPPTGTNSNRELEVLWVLALVFTGTSSSSLSFWSLCANGWYRKLWLIATTVQLKEDWIRVLFWGAI